MRILNVFSPTSYHVSETTIRFFKENFQGDNYAIAVIGKTKRISANPVPRNLTGVKYFNSYFKNFIKIRRYFARFDKIVFHALSIEQIIALTLMYQPSLINKIVWVAWGYDLYNWKIDDANIEKRIPRLAKIAKTVQLAKVLNTINYNFKRKINSFVGIFPPDIEHFKKEFNANAQTFYASYVGGLYNPLFKKELKLVTLAEKVKNNECINIQIGHSCTPQVNHIKVLEDLAKFKDENNKIYLPLSYGDMQYGDQVEEKAKAIFSEKAICIREMMDKDKYMDFLSTMDIAIFNTQRQIGLGNIAPLIFMEKKIYMPMLSIMYEHFTSKGISICDYNRIKDMSFEEFIKPVDMKNAKEHIITSVDKERLKKLWANVFDAPLA